jgi:hypothetical protein
MKKLLGLSVVLMIVLSSCSFETYQCAAYSHHRKPTKHGHKAQAKYHKRSAKGILN